MTLTITCATCGDQLVPGDRFCSGCGTPVPGAVLTTIATPPPSPWTLILERLRAATAGEFQIIRELGRGGMAAVYLAQETALNRRVAIKVMAPGLMMGEGMVERFRQEAVTIANLSHPNIITIHAVRRFEDLHFFVMKFVDGQPLDAVLRTAGVLPIPIVRAILFQVGSGLAYAHRRGVIHRDVKPANVLLDKDGTAIVTDFGIAKVAETPGHTQTGMMVGTPAYMSPEQCVADKLTWSSDQYSLGVVAYELLTGVPPFSGSSYSTMQGHLEKPPRSPCELRNECPADMEAAILRMLAKSPSERFGTMADALRALGARPLLEDDPLREELDELVAAAAGTNAAIEASKQPGGPPSPPIVRTVPPPRSAASVTVGGPDHAEAGDRFALTAEVADADGNPMEGRRVAWSSSNPDVASIGETGEVVARAPGTTAITATADGVTGSVMVVIAAAGPATIEIAGAPRSIEAGQTARLTAIIRDRHGAPVDTEPAWSSSDPAIAEISDGLLRTRRPGSIRVVLAAAGLETSADVDVVPVPVARVRVEGPRTAMAGAPFALTGEALDAAGRRLEERAITWISSDPESAPITDDGVVSPSRRGSVTFTARSEAASGSLKVRIRAVGQRRIWPLAVPGLAVLVVGALLLSRGDEEAPAPTTAPAAVVPAPAAAAPVVVAPPGDSSPESQPPSAPTGAGASDSVIERARPDAPVTLGSITLATPPPLVEGDTIRLRATLRDANRRVLTDRTLVWRSDNPAIVSIGRASGVAVARAPGRATVSASAEGRTGTVMLVIAARPEPAAQAPAPAPAAEPPPQPSTPSAAAGETAARSLAGECVTALQAGDANRVERLYSAVSAADRKNVEDLLKLLRRPEADFSASAPTAAAPKVAGTRATAEFGTDLSWKTSFGPRRRVTVAWVAEVRAAGATWQPVGCRMQGDPRL